jgi:thiamine biosynthesis lipoprotein
MVRTEFDGMGGSIEVQLVDGTAAQSESIRALFQESERALSRFLPDSELSALNESGGRPFAASPLLFDAVSEAIGWACITDGVFDPTVIDILEAAGYDRSFDEIRGGVAVATRQLPRPQTKRFAAIDIDVERGGISMPQGVRLDLGGIGKGFTVDRAIASLGAGANALVNASGDLFAAGAGPEGEGWYVSIQDPRGADADLAVLNVSDRGVATSGSIKRRWSDGDARYHHLIDARRGAPSESGLLTVTVVALTATHADVLAKTAFLLGPREGLRFIERFPDAECIAVHADGTNSATSGMAEHYA